MLKALKYVNYDAYATPALFQEQQSSPDIGDQAFPSQCIIFEAPKRTYQPNFLKRKRNHGFLKRVRKQSGRKIINLRRAKGRKRLAAL